jgi:hypothetical protein
VLLTAASIVMADRTAMAASSRSPDVADAVEASHHRTLQRSNWRAGSIDDAAIKIFRRSAMGSIVRAMAVRLLIPVDVRVPA